MKPVRALWLPACLILGGCVPPSTPPSQPLPVAWKNAAGFPTAAPSRDLSRWWGRFGDPVLSHVISGALENNPDIVTASSRIKEARARRKAEVSTLFPSVSGSGGTGISQDSRSGISEYSNSFSAGLDASWELDLFGRRRSSIEAASAELDATVENLHSIQASLASEVAIAYLSLRSIEARLAIVRDSLQSREETYNLAKFRLQAGTIDTLEPDQAYTSLQQARASIPSLEQSASEFRNLIALLSGRNPGALDSTLASGKRSIPVPPSSLAVGIPADTIRQRPDVRVAGYQLLSAAATTRSVQADRYPSLNLSGSLGLGTLRSGKLFDPESASAGLAAGITSPIFDAGRISANIEAQQAVEEQRVQTYRSTVLTALSEVEDALVACKRSAERLETLRLAEESARNAASLAQQRYEAGVTDILTVLDSQRSLLSLEETIASVTADRSIAYVQLYKALGGGWSAQ